MKKNLVTIILCAILCVGCLFIESNEFVALAFIGIVGGVVAVKDYRRIKAFEESKRLNVKTEQELKDMLKEMIEI